VHLDGADQQYLVSSYDDIEACYRNPAFTTRCYGGSSSQRWLGKRSCRWTAGSKPVAASMIMNSTMRGTGWRSGRRWFRYHTRKLSPDMRGRRRAADEGWDSGAGFELGKSLPVYLPTTSSWTFSAAGRATRGPAHGWARSIMEFLWQKCPTGPRGDERGQAGPGRETADVLAAMIADRRRSRATKTCQALCEAADRRRPDERRGHVSSSAS